MDRILDGAQWHLVHDPSAGEQIGTTADGHPFYGYTTTPQASAPDVLVIYYWDDGERLHLMYCERGDHAEAS